MNLEDIAVGLDIGTTKIVAIVAQKSSEGRIKVLGVGHAPSTGVLRGVVTNISRTTESIIQAVQMAEGQAGISISDLVVGIAGQHIRRIQHPDYITRDEHEEVIDRESGVKGKRVWYGTSAMIEVDATNDTVRVSTQSHYKM